MMSKTNPVSLDILKFNNRGMPELLLSTVTVSTTSKTTNRRVIGVGVAFVHRKYAKSKDTIAAAMEVNPQGLSSDQIMMLPPPLNFLY
jgi:hypothetical protein